MSEFFETPWTVARQALPTHGISQARILEWVAISSSRGSSQPRDRTHVSCIAGRFFTTEPPRKPRCIEVGKEGPEEWNLMRLLPKGHHSLNREAVAPLQIPL